MMSLLRLTYNRANDGFEQYSFISDPYAIWDLWWQLTRNYQCSDGTKIGDVVVTNLDGHVLDMNNISRAQTFAYATNLYDNRGN